jgi:succinoglycan biosynthesis transport protein ExoP
MQQSLRESQTSDVAFGNNQIELLRQLMNIFHIFRVLMCRKKIVILTIILTTLAAISLNVMWPKTYKGTTLIIMAYKAPDPISGLTVPVQLVPNYVATQVDILTSKSVALSVVDRLKLITDDENLRLWMKTKRDTDIRDWIAERLMKNLDVTASRESSVLTVVYNADTPQKAAAIANAFAHAYQQMDLQLKVEPLQNAGAYLNQQLILARRQLEETQKRYSDFQQANGVLSGDNRDDLESTLLAGLTAQITEVEARLLEAESRQQLIAGGAASSAPEVLSSPLIQTLSNNVAVARSRMAATAMRHSSSHPNYLSDKQNLDVALLELQKQSTLITQSVINSVAALKTRLASLRAAQSVEKARVMRLNGARDQLAILKREVDSATRAFDLLKQRSTQLSLEGRADRSDIAILSKAQPVHQPAGPGLRTVAIMAVILGSVLGCSAALFQELVDSRVRSKEDADKILAVPMLGQFSISAVPTTRTQSRTPPLTELQ